MLARVSGALQWTQVTAAMHANSGAVAGTYDRVTVNLSGHVTSGAYNYGNIFTKNVNAAVQFFSGDCGVVHSTAERDMEQPMISLEATHTERIAFGITIFIGLVVGI